MHEHRKTVGHGSLPAGMIDATEGTALAARCAGGGEGGYGDSKSLLPPNPGMRLALEHAALVVIDPRIDFSSPKGSAWPFLGGSVGERKIIQNLARLFEASRYAGITVAI